ncbi:bifunctional indole-3-glycerol-phosphate synthase TrpC/phosphoribosylanthranilate isomerase TrpF [Ferrimonas balearica]|uniref:bifunctional indole-3-glycerol-phosphate synthase TrpC/phosphoribosylanthranilate isomerase TrpF n=1 Tax=Ferrimonas balearica TaxID=44012 RepID=UPI001C9908EA|nr:bifunctional indole-3-glycerol-phosphate synthase TrpC/phosphoribosylanthranilate isomerase TrpF [Ferrimonas balearica]MBY5993838.1 bifunctional indole-3-glycerol-phosphate synthase TrpC/phosphoribosylanthranilate isomerase TrpF [Ferrimonas balearica]
MSVTGVQHTDTVLDRIVATKPAQIARLSERYGEMLETRAAPSERSLFEALKAKPTGFILECKKASPSKGLIRADFDPVAIGTVYDRYAAGISVLTDEEFFQGDFEYLKAVREAVSVPVLCKDFIIDVRQLRLARHLGADAALLMLSVLDDTLYRTLAEEADALGLDVLTEVSNQAEMTRAIALGAKIIGINNRDLRDLSIDLATTERLAGQVPDDRVVISESGIYTHAQVRRLAPHADAFLVGSSLTEQDNVDLACRQLIFGPVKVCGLTRPEDAQAVAQAGGSYGGLIFAAKSPRCVTPEQADTVRAAADLRYVGVFVNDTIERVAQLAQRLDLFAVQLHGSEDEAYVEALRRQIGETQIWKAVKPDGSHSVRNADRILFDSAKAGQFGGTGSVFDWTLVGSERAEAMLAGGLGPDNVADAAQAGFYGLDLNSGVEQSAGIKDADKIQSCLAAVRQY